MKRPSFQFYPGDWLRDTALRSCSVGARGLWIDMICLMHEGNPYGHLKVNHKVILPANLARMTGLTPLEAEGYLEELETAGVLSKTDEGCFFSKRMIRDEEIRKLRADGGKLGGNPKLLGESKVQERLTSEVKQKPTPSSSSSSSSSKKEINPYIPFSGEEVVLEKIQKEPQTKKRSRSKKEAPPPSAEVLEIFAYWQKQRKQGNCILNSVRILAINAMLAEKYTVQRIKDAIDGIQYSPHHMGENKQKTVYDDIELICRNGINVDKFAELKHKHENKQNKQAIEVPDDVEYESIFRVQAEPSISPPHLA